MGPSPTAPTAYGPRDYHAVARRCGYRYTRLMLEPEGREAGEECALFAGQLDIEEPQPGLLITCSDVVQLHEASAEAEMGPGLMVGVSLAGPIEARLDGGGAVSLETGGAIAMHIERPVGFSGYQARGRRQCMFSVFARPEWLDACDLTRLVPRADATGLASRHWSPSPRLGSRLREAMQFAQDDPIGRLIKESIALEFLAEALRQLAPATSADPGLRPAELARMTRIRDRLVAAPDEAFSLAELARDAGVSVTILKDGFRRAFGCSVFGFLRELRMDRARALIEDGWTVAQAAYYVGYRHPSNFTAAFRRRFGAPPRRLARERPGA